MASIPNITEYKEAILKRIRTASEQASTPPSAAVTLEEALAPHDGDESPPLEMEVDDDAHAISVRDGTRTNYAAASSGAVVLAHNAEMSGVAALLSRDADAYALSRCDARKWVVIALSEPVIVDELVISNEEKYSSTLKSFRLLGGTRFPATEWFVLGNFSAANKLGEQRFRVAVKQFVSHVKIVWLTHHGSEFYCTWTRVRVHGSTVLETAHSTMLTSEAEIMLLQSLNTGAAVLNPSVTPTTTPAAASPLAHTPAEDTVVASSVSSTTAVGVASPAAMPAEHPSNVLGDNATALHTAAPSLPMNASTLPASAPAGGNATTAVCNVSVTEATSSTSVSTTLPHNTSTRTQVAWNGLSSQQQRWEDAWALPVTVARTHVHTASALVAHTHPVNSTADTQQQPTPPLDANNAPAPAPVPSMGSSDKGVNAAHVSAVNTTLDAAAVHAVMNALHACNVSAGGRADTPPSPEVLQEPARLWAKFVNVSMLDEEAIQTCRVEQTPEHADACDTLMRFMSHTPVVVPTLAPSSMRATSSEVSIPATRIMAASSLSSPPQDGHAVDADAAALARIVQYASGEHGAEEMSLFSKKMSSGIHGNTAAGSHLGLMSALTRKLSQLEMEASVVQKYLMDLHNTYSGAILTLARQSNASRADVHALRSRVDSAMEVLQASDAPAVLARLVTYDAVLANATAELGALRGLAEATASAVATAAAERHVPSPAPLPPSPACPMQPSANELEEYVSEGWYARVLRVRRMVLDPASIPVMPPAALAMLMRDMLLSALCVLVVACLCVTLMAAALLCCLCRPARASATL